MSQRGVERTIGRLVTDEEFRQRFATDPVAILVEGVGCGVELTNLEVEALASIDRSLLEQLADTLDPRIQKVRIQGGMP